MDNCLLAAFYGFHRLLDDVRPGLRQDLDRNAVGDQVVVDQMAAEIKISLGSRGETYLDLLEAYLAQEGKELNLLVERHGDFQRLVPVS